MKLGQILIDRAVTAAIFDDGGARPLIGHTLMDLLDHADRSNCSLADVARRMTAPEAIPAAPILPIHPREVWACGCTYEMSASFRDAEHGTREGFYRYVYMPEHRPELFFKGTARVCVGAGGAIGIRRDSKFTAPEPELAMLLDAKGRIHGYTIANDVSAWDIERENPLYLPQSKTYNACCAVGPVIATPDELTDPYALEMTLRVFRGGRVTFEGATSIGKLGRRLETLVEYLLRSNAIPCGTLLLTGTGIIVQEDAALQPGDICEISVPGIGVLRNPVEVV